MCLLAASASSAAVFTVTPADDDCSDFVCDLQNALEAAASNGQDAVINLAEGIYTFPSTIAYIPTATSGENYSLTIKGAGEDVTLDRFSLSANSGLTLATNGGALIIGHLQTPCTEQTCVERIS